MTTPLERLVGPIRATDDPREHADLVGEAVVRAAAADRERFVAVVASEPSLLESGTLVWALGAIDDARLVAPLAAALRGKSPNVRWSAARALANHRDPRAVAALVEALADRAPTVRAAVVEALGDLGDRLALPPLREAAARASNRKLGALFHEAIRKLEA